VTFIHEDSEFEDLLRIVAERRGLSLGLVEKDYWVTHALWALHAQGLDVWFKGGTSLSKGFGIIERFSEDLDLKIDPGRVEGLPLVSNWKSEGAKATKERRDFFDRLASLLVVPHRAKQSAPGFLRTSHSDRWRVTRASVDEQAHGYAGPAPSRVSSRLAFLEAHRRLAALL
jgi:hypothetical protein